MGRRRIKVPETDRKRFFFQEYIANIDTPHKYAKTQTRLDSRRSNRSTNTGKRFKSTDYDSMFTSRGVACEEEENSVCLESALLTPLKPKFTPIRFRTSNLNIPQSKLAGKNKPKVSFIGVMIAAKAIET
jgi:hypothetical protein